ncbi:MAG: monovalent cation/H(+) antiporter subunit G [Magnetospiraceae bacterium]
MGIILDILSAICLIGGSAITVIGTVGLIRFPDVYARMHATGMTDTLGAGLIILGLVLQATGILMAIKLVMIIVFLLYTSPISTHALARAAIAGGLRPWLNAPDQDPAPESETAPEKDAE